jgi:RNA polymerase sigma-70 factor (ECF subfamily)
MRRYQTLIYGLVYHQVGNFTDAQDVAQEAFIKAFRSIDQLTEPERFGSWLKSTAANECRMWLRSRQGTIPLDEVEALPSYTRLADEKWRQRERQAEIAQAVESLPEKSRLVMTLYYLSGLSCREIGESMGIAENAVKQHLHRARKQLKEIMMSEIEEDYAMNRLPEDFTEKVLGRVMLCPTLTDGQFISVPGEDDLCGMVIGIGENLADRSFACLWSNKDDHDAIALGLHDSGAEQTAKGRAFRSALNMLNVLGVELKQVALHLTEPTQCMARVTLMQGDTEFALDMRPSDALGLAIRVKAPIYVEEPVVSAGNVSEDGLPVREGAFDSAEWRTFIITNQQYDTLMEKPWEIGLSPEDLIDTVRLRRNEAEGTLTMWLEALPDQVHTFSLDEYSLGAQWIFDHAHDGRVCDPNWLRGKLYKTQYTLLGEDARIRFTPSTAEWTGFPM